MAANMGDRGKTGSRPREPSGRLMAVIKTLLASEDLSQREVEKRKLENEYKQLDKQLGKLVEAHYSDLQVTVQSFSGISARITNSREKLATLKENLTSCKALLHCKRDEIRKLWLEGVEHKHVLALLRQIEEVKETTQKLEEYMSKKHYLHATELLTLAVETLEDSLSDVDALRELKADLQKKQAQLHEVLIDELHVHLYEKSASFTKNTFKRGGSHRGSGRKDVSSTPIRKPTLLEQVTVPSAGVKGLHSKSITRTPVVGDYLDDEPKHIIEDLNDNAEEDSVHYMSILIESLYVLKKLPDAIEAIKRRMQAQLTKIIDRTTTDILNHVNQRGEPVPKQDRPKLLLELLEVLFEKFRCVAVAHMLTLTALKRIKRRSSEENSASQVPNTEFELYDMQEVWSNIQAALQMLLGDYLDVQNTTTTKQETPTTFSNTTTDIGSYFSKRRPNRPKMSLFKFEQSSHAISMNNYLREQKQPGFYGLDTENQEKDIDEPRYVCDPSAKNITEIFNTLRLFIREIEVNTGCIQGSHCTLHGFISDFIKDIFLGQVHCEINSKIELVTKGGDGLKSLIDASTQKMLGVSKPLLQSTITVEKAVSELRELMKSLPAYADQFLAMICKVLQGYKDICHNAYRGIVQPEAEDKRIISATWAKDEDISRLLRSLPNWINLQNHRKENAEIEVESVDEIRARNTKESELLIGNLGDKVIPKHEVLLDVNDLKSLANLHESLEWFTGKVQSLASQLSNSPAVIMAIENRPSDIPVLPESSLNSLVTLAKEFQDMAETCLLVLHLEIRVHCFYFLMPILMQTSFSSTTDISDPDSNTLKMNKDLVAIEEALSISLQQHKFKYILEGIGHLIASILVNGAQYIKRMNEYGIKKMCRNIFSIQQNLTNITMSREADLDNARQYYELLDIDADEILDKIVGQGPAFDELQYLFLLKLQHRSRAGTSQKLLTKREQRLREIMKQANGI
ncbi:exocyst complex component 4-like isoform X2 [Ptychodera flava]|uniref:exocyst complex component 4-like isoform X2 n=1 Tax=Ptychodera flava TaxID=63121 RepID=UPI00396A5A15